MGFRESASNFLSRFGGSSENSTTAAKPSNPKVKERFGSTSNMRVPDELGRPQRRTATHSSQNIENHLVREPTPPPHNRSSRRNAHKSEFEGGITRSNEVQASYAPLTAPNTAPISNIKHPRNDFTDHDMDGGVPLSHNVPYLQYSQPTDDHGIDDISAQVEALKNERDRLGEDVQWGKSIHVAQTKEIQERDEYIARLRTDIVELKSDIEDLETALKKSKRVVDNSKEERAKLYKDKLLAESKVEAQVRHLDEIMRQKTDLSNALTEVRADLRNVMDDLMKERTTTEHLRSRIRDLKNTVAQQNIDLTKVGNNRPTSKHDDAYFDSSLTRIFESCNQWAFNLCKNGIVSDDTLHSFSQALKEECAIVAGPENDWISLFKKDAARMAEAVLVHIVVKYVFSYERLLPILCGDIFTFILKGTLTTSDDESFRLRVMTLQRLQQQPHFHEGLHSYLERCSGDILENLNNCAHTPARPLSEEKQIQKLRNRHKKLLDILKDAANVCLEMLQEPAEFCFFSVVSGMEFKEDTMTQAEVRRDQGVQLEVELMASPGVEKKKHGAKVPMVLKKAKVYMREVQATFTETASEKVADQERFADPVDEVKREASVDVTEVMVEAETLIP